ncbi:MAG: hypothetical protein ACXAC2_19410, partial [Candidatus Kariarchaeaceae archaeon]
DVKWISSLTPLKINNYGICYSTNKISGYSREAFLEGYYDSYSDHAFGWIPQESTFWKRDLWNKMGGALDISYNMAGDFWLWSQFYTRSLLYGIDTPLAAFRIHKDQKTNKSIEYKNEVELILSFKKRSNIKDKYIKLCSKTKLAILQNIIVNYYGFIAYKILKDNQSIHLDNWKIKEYRFI